MAKPQYRWPPCRHGCHPNQGGLRTHILERDNHLCQLRLKGCTMTATAVDHTLPTSHGGPWFDDTGLRAACAPCNTARSNRATPPTANW